MMTITDDIRQQVIKEYEAEKYLDKCRKSCKAKPLGRAQKYFNLLTNYIGSHSTNEWRRETNERIKEQVRRKYGIGLITDLGPEFYDEANEYAIELFTKETEDGGYRKDNIIVYDLPWVRNRFTGRMQHTAFPHTWEEWKKRCYDSVHN